jgi:dihydroorotate dehydrogenase (fumarate)
MDLTTRYLGLTLKNPLIASASPLTGDLGNIRRLEDCGAAAIVLPSIFEEQIEAEQAETERLTTARGESFAEALSYFPAAIAGAIEPHGYLEISCPKGRGGSSPLARTNQISGLGTI